MSKMLLQWQNIPKPIGVLGLPGSTLHLLSSPSYSPPHLLLPQPHNHRSPLSTREKLLFERACHRYLVLYLLMIHRGWRIR